MEFNNVLLEKEGNIATVTINRPKALNALNSETLKELNAVIEDLENDNNIYCVILTGSGEKSFVAGADIAEIITLASGSPDVAVIIEANHSCMTARGIRKAGSKTVTTTLRGRFEEDMSLQLRFFRQ